MRNVGLLVVTASIVGATTIAGLTGCGRDGADSAGVDARVEAAQTALAGGSPWPAMWTLTRLATEEHSPAAMRALGLAAYGMGAAEDAAAWLDRATEAGPLDVDATLIRADACLQTNRFAEADRLFGEAIERGADPASAHAARAWAREQKGDRDGAIADRRAALAADPSDRESRVALAALLLDNATPDVAEVVSLLAGGAPVTSPADSARTEFLLARAGERTGDLAAARRHAERAVALQPEPLEELHALARICRLLGDRDAARDASSRHRAALDRKASTQRTRSMQDVTDAAAELERGDRPAAIARLRAARDAHPDALDVHALLGPLLQQADEREEAFRSFTVLRGATGGDIPTPLFLRTAQELRRRGLPRAAAFLFEVALSRSPDSEEARYYLALSLLEAGDAPAAVEAGRPLESPPPSS